VRGKDRVWLNRSRTLLVEQEENRGHSGMEVGQCKVEVYDTMGRKLVRHAGLEAELLHTWH
jgi:hypothetical protein